MPDRFSVRQWGLLGIRLLSWEVVFYGAVDVRDSGTAVLRFLGFSVVPGNPSLDLSRVRGGIHLIEPALLVQLWLVR